MAKKNKVSETHTSIDTLNDNLISMGEKIQKNKKKIVTIGLIVAIIVAAFLAYFLIIRKGAIHAADAAAGKADTFAAVPHEGLSAHENDSIIAANYNAAAEAGYKSGNRARLMAAIKLYEMGEYRQALDAINKYSAGDELVGPAALSLKGDCYVNLAEKEDGTFDAAQLNQAAGAFKEAIALSDNNPAYTPFFMLKLARVYHELGNYSAEADLLREINTKYPEYVRMANINVERDLRRAELLQNK